MSFLIIKRIVDERRTEHSDVVTLMIESYIFDHADGVTMQKGI